MRLNTFMKTFTLLVVVMVMTIAVVSAAAIGEKRQVIGNVTNEMLNEVYQDNVRIEQWTGHNFTFLTLPADQQAAGYEIFAVEQAKRGFEGDRSARISYAEHVGKQVTVTEIVTFAAGYNQQEYMVYMTVNDTGEKLTGRTMRGQLEGLVLTADLNNARQQFLGKTVYPKFRELSGLYVPGWNTAMPAAISIAIGSPVTVVDVYAGNQSQEPVWLIVSVNGEKAILPIAYSWTNIPIQSWTRTPPWQNALFTEDPRLSFGWSHYLWDKIENGIVEEGMTKGQIQLSWGKPFRTEANDTVWIYGTKKLSFYGEVLQSIETLPEDSVKDLTDMHGMMHKAEMKRHGIN